MNAFINTDSTRIAWTANLKSDLARGTALAFDATRIVPSLYLAPVNPAFKPLVVTAAEASTVRVIAEVVQVLRP